MNSFRFLKGAGKHHSLPVFEGRTSRRHEDVSYRDLLRRARSEDPGRDSDFAGVRSFLQFAGFPRSGHSLIGAILSAHPALLLAHELDVMGLVAKKFPQTTIFRLIRQNAEAFDASDRWWNGLKYDVPPLGGHDGRTLVIGDKKGDWAARHALRQPDLVRRLEREVAAEHLWINVTRDPFDNIAVMTLRRGRLYDRMRIAAESSGDFHASLKRAIGEGELPSATDDEMIEDYAQLLKGVEIIRGSIPQERWLHVGYEAFIERPRPAIAELFRFVNLPLDRERIERAASIVRPGRSRPSRLLSWSPAQRRRVETMIAKHEILRGYRDGRAA